MLFLSSVTLLLLSVLVTVARIIHIEVQQEGTFANADCFLTLLPETLYTPAIFLLSCVLVLFTTVFFLLPVLLLGLIQLRNFCVAKTTNERFAKRSSSVASDRSQSQTSGGHRSGSIASGRLSMEQSIDQMLT